MILLALSAHSLARADAVSIPVICNGVEVGTIAVQSVPADASHPAGVVGGFYANVPRTLAGVAAFCGEDHFNWLQVITSDPSPPVDKNGNRLVPPYIDPPIGGYGDDPNTPGDETQWADDKPWLWDEYPPDPDQPPPKGYEPRYQLSARTHIFDLDYFDFPIPRQVGDTIEIITGLVSLDAHGNLDSFHGEFTWEVTRTGATTDVVSNLRRNTPGPAAFSMLASVIVVIITLRRRRMVSR
jgi:hypothetical protein